MSLRDRVLLWFKHPFADVNRMWTWGGLAMLVGLVLRVWSIHQARFSGEESWFWGIGREIATGQSFPVLGHPISGTAARHPGAAFFWFLGLTQLGGASPLRAYAVVSLSGWLVLPPLSVAVARAFDRDTGLAFLILTAVSPWWIVYTNSAWPSYLIPTLCALLLVWLPSLIDRRPRFAQAALAFLLLIGFQIHLSLLHYWLIALVTVAVWRPRLTRVLLIGAVLGCLCYVPYLVYELGHTFANTAAIAQRSQTGGRSWTVLQGLLLYFLGFTTTDLSYLWNQGYWFPFDLARFWRGPGVAQTTGFFARTGAVPLAWTALVVTWVFTISSWAFFVHVLWRRFRANGRRQANVLPLAFVTAVAAIPFLYLLSGKGGYPHYVSTVLPLAFLPAAALLGRLLKHRVARWAAVAYVALFASAGFLGLRGYYAVDSRWSIKQSTAAVDFILAKTRNRDGQYRPFRLNYGFSPNWPSSYQLIATHVFHAPFLASGGPDVFHVDARLPGQPVITNGPPPPPGSAVDTLVLPTLVVRHHRGPAPPVSGAP
ncbi:MAG: hypothetical protein H7X95_02520 [Deltaproteobacteria bacterium]|nr:hypothetical protein [Deltaproteobacteria bacterium]